MAVLNSRNQTPPDGWNYTQLETQTRFELEGNGSLAELVERVCQHRTWKGLKPDDPSSVQLDIERQICAQMPEGICSGEPGEKYEAFNDQSRTLTLAKIESFSSALFTWIKAGAHFVPQEIAIARGDICRGCPFNKNPKSCSCAPLWALLASIIPSSRRQHSLHVCGICGCSLEAKVLAPADVLRDSERGLNHRFPSYCWLNSALHGG
jgi:hypothetical protein